MLALTVYKVGAKLVLHTRQAKMLITVIAVEKFVKFTTVVIVKCLPKHALMPVTVVIDASQKKLLS